MFLIITGFFSLPLQPRYVTLASLELSHLPLSPECGTSRTLACKLSLSGLYYTEVGSQEGLFVTVFPGYRSSLAVDRVKCFLFAEPSSSRQSDQIEYKLSPVGDGKLPTAVHFRARQVCPQVILQITLVKHCFLFPELSLGLWRHQGSYPGKACSHFCELQTWGY